MPPENGAVRPARAPGEVRYGHMDLGYRLGAERLEYLKRLRHLLLRGQNRAPAVGVDVGDVESACGA